MGVSPASVTTYTPNALNQYSAITNQQSTILNPVHDDDGNMTSGPLPSDIDSASALIWDAENRLIETTVGTSGPLVRYHYDAQSRLISRSVGTLSTAYIYDAWNRIAEYAQNESGHSLKRSYLFGMDLSESMQGAGGVGGLLAVSHHGPQSAIYYPTYDGNGNVSEYLDSIGVIKAHFEYDPFGNTLLTAPLASEDATLKDTFDYRFSTKPIDSITGLLYYGYRWYDPVTGRWPSRDPIEERGGVNLYGFVRNDANRHIDPFGLEETLPSSFTVGWQKANDDRTKMLEWWADVCEITLVSVKSENLCVKGTAGSVEVKLKIKKGKDYDAVVKDQLGYDATFLDHFKGNVDVTTKGDDETVVASGDELICTVKFVLPACPVGLQNSGKENIYFGAMSDRMAGWSLTFTWTYNCEPKQDFKATVDKMLKTPNGQFEKGK